MNDPSDDVEASPMETVDEAERVRLLLDQQQDMRASLRTMEEEVSRLRSLLQQTVSSSLRRKSSQTDVAPFIKSIAESNMDGDDVEKPLDQTEDQGWFLNVFHEMFDNHNEEEQEAEDDDFMDSLPEDSFSLMLVSPICSIPFMSALSVLCVQLLAYSLLTFNQMHGNAGTGNIFGIPSMVAPAVRFTQVIALAITALTQDLLRTGLLEAYKGYVPETVGNSFKHVSRTRWIINSIVRCMEGSLGLLVTFILIMTAETVIDLLLNFTAMEFVSQLVRGLCYTMKCLHVSSYPCLLCSGRNLFQFSPQRICRKAESHRSPRRCRDKIQSSNCFGIKENRW